MLLALFTLHMILYGIRSKLINHVFLSIQMNNFELIVKLMIMVYYDYLGRPTEFASQYFSKLNDQIFL